MADWENYYELLGVDPRAGADDIRSAYRARAMDLHPNRLVGVADEVRRLAEDRLKQVNRAYEVLGDAAKRKEYHATWQQRFIPPRPVVEPPVIRFNAAAPGELLTASFVIRNAGGPYSEIHVGNPSTWVEVTGYRSLTDQDELPLHIEIAARGSEWGQTYVETITEGLDAQETQVQVNMRTAEPVTVTVTTRVGATRVARQPAGGLDILGRIRGRGRPAYESRPQTFETYILDGFGTGIRWAGSWARWS